MEILLSTQEKTTVRQAVLKKRGDFFTKGDPESASDRIIQRLKQTPAYQSAETILCFVSFGTEVMTHEFIKQALVEGKRVLVPYIRTKAEGMLASELKDFSELEVGYYNILAPKEDCLRLINEQPDLVIVPSVAFSQDGYRIGYGGGFYDRYLGAQTDRSHTIGIAFSVQVVDRVPVEDFDIPVDQLITEEAVYDFRPTKISFRDIDQTNYYDLIDLKLRPDQDDFVSDPIQSLADCWLRRHDKTLFVRAVYHEEELIGYLLYHHDPKKDHLYLWRLMIGDRYQAKGYGRQTMVQIIELAKRLGAKAIKTDYVLGNDTVRHLLESLGFVEVGFVEKYQEVAVELRWD